MSELLSLRIAYYNGQPIVISQDIKGTRGPLFPLQFAGAVVVFAAFLAVIAATYVAVAVHEILAVGDRLRPIGRR